MGKIHVCLKLLANLLNLLTFFPATQYHYDPLIDSPPSHVDTFDKHDLHRGIPEELGNEANFPCS